MSRIRWNDWRSLSLWVLGLALCLLCLGAVIRNESARQLQHGAEAAGLQWANFASRTVPDLDRLFADSTVTPQAREQLLRLRSADGVFRFKLFDPAGRVVLVSDDLDHPKLVRVPSSARGIGEHHGGGEKSHIRDKVLSGVNHIELKYGKDAGRPAVYSEAYVPVLRAGNLLGVVEVYVDQTAEAQVIWNAFFRVAAAMTALVALMLLAFAFQFWRHRRAQQLAEERLQHMAHHDVLSGTLNRSGFNAALSRACCRREAGGPGFSVLCIDLDHFKDVNDKLGHAAGDEVLRQTTQRLREAVRDSDAVARLGGDEFAVLLSGVTTVAGVTPLAQRIVKLLAEPYEVTGQRINCSGSVGAAIHGVEATEQAQLLHYADLALYRAKAAGRGTFSFHDAANDDLLKARRRLTRDLQEALHSEQLSLHYQSLHDCKTRALTGYEALLRWNHPTRGNVPPLDFIALAEETGLIDALGLWILNRACTDAAGWPEPLTVAINLSPAQLTRSDLVGLVLTALADSGLPARRLELEITESMLMVDTDKVLAQLHELSALGVSIAMDDFGTGYSSLAYLWRFPFNKVKIDRAFTQNLDDPKVNLIVSSIISLAHSLNIRVNAEGVETSRQLATLKAQGCDEVQGFHLGRPSPLAVLSHAGCTAVPSAPASAAGSRSAPREAPFADLPTELAHSGA